MLIQTPHPHLSAEAESDAIQIKESDNPLLRCKYRSPMRRTVKGEEANWSIIPEASGKRLRYRATAPCQARRPEAREGDDTCSEPPPGCL